MTRAHRAGRRTLRRSVVGRVLTLVGVLLWLGSLVASHREDHSYTDGGAPPQYVHVTRGGTYTISVTGGLGAARELGVNPAALQCTSTPRGGSSTGLATTPETNTKAEQTVASFVAGATGDVHVACEGLEDLYVDDADGAFDLAGLLIVLASICLAVGLPLQMSALAVRFSPVQRVDPAAEGAFQLQRDGHGDVVVPRRADGLDPERET